MLGAVIAIFFQVEEPTGGEDSDAAENDFLNSVFDIVDLPNDYTTGTVRMLDFLQNVDFSAYWNYNGSLTKPPCQEGIKWTVIKKVQKMSKKQFKRIQYQIPGEGNNRLIQRQSAKQKVYYSGAMRDSVLQLVATAALIFIPIFL